MPNSDSSLCLRQALLALHVPLEDLSFQADGGLIDNKENNSGSRKDGQDLLQRQIPKGKFLMFLGNDLLKERKKIFKWN